MFGADVVFPARFFEKYFSCISREVQVELKRVTASLVLPGWLQVYLLVSKVPFFYRLSLGASLSSCLLENELVFPL